MKSDVVLSAAGTPAADAKGRFSWALYHWAREVWGIVGTVIIFAPYFANGVVGDPVRGQALWGGIYSVAGFALAICAPFFGAIADITGRQKIWLGVLTAIIVMGTFSLWWATPNEQGFDLHVTVFTLGLLYFCYASTEIFHNSMLPFLAPADKLGALSGLGIAMCWGSSLLVMSFMLYSFMLPGEVDWAFIPEDPLFGIDPAQSEPSRLIGPIGAIWLLVFSLPLFLFVPRMKVSTPIGTRAAISQGARQVFTTIKEARRYGKVFHFLVARMLYNDAMISISVFGGIYAVGIFGWTPLTLTLYGVVLAIFSIAGGFFGGWLDDRLGSKTAIMISVIMVFIGVVTAVSVTPQTYFFFFPVEQDSAKVWDLPFFQTKAELIYLVAVLIVTVFVAAANGSNRTFLARIAPPEKMAEFFGLYAMSGTVTAFLAPGLIAIMTNAFESQRIGFASLLILLVAGFALLLFVPDERAHKSKLA